MIKDINKFEKSLKIKFKNKSLIIEALTHKSANQQNNNEKLEFLGDRVLGLVLSKKLFDLYPNENEGVLDKKFANLLSKFPSYSSGYKSINFLEMTNPKTLSPKNSSFSLFSFWFSLLCVNAFFNKDLSLKFTLIFFSNLFIFELI